VGYVSGRHYMTSSVSDVGVKWDAYQADVIWWTVLVADGLERA